MDKENKEFNTSVEDSLFNPQQTRFYLFQTASEKLFGNRNGPTTGIAFGINRNHFLGNSLHLFFNIQRDVSLRALFLMAIIYTPLPNHLVPISDEDLRMKSSRFREGLYIRYSYIPLCFIYIGLDKPSELLELSDRFDYRKKGVREPRWINPWTLQQHNLLFIKHAFGEGFLDRPEHSVPWATHITLSFLFIPHSIPRLLF